MYTLTVGFRSAEPLIIRRITGERTLSSLCAVASQKSISDYSIAKEEDDLRFDSRRQLGFPQAFRVAALLVSRRPSRMPGLSMNLQLASATAGSSAAPIQPQCGTRKNSCQT